MTIKQAIKKYTQELKKLSSSPVLDVEVLLEFILKKSKIYIFSHPEKKITSIQEKKLRQLISQRKKYQPIAYLTGQQEFYGLKFEVNKNVLIPRPETEQLIEEAIKCIKNKKLKSVADIGTGSGAVIIALTRNTNLKNYFGTDICQRTLKVADFNIKKHKLKNKIKLLHGNLLEPLKNKKIDLIVTNLPYLDNKEMKEPTIKAEPQKALSGGRDGLDKFREFFEQLKSLKYQPKIIILEIGWKQAGKLKKLVPPNYQIKIKKDLCGRDRVMVLEKR